MKQPVRIRPSTKANARGLRRRMTGAERLLWGHLRRRQVAGLKFRRQHPLGQLIVDFVCIEAALLIEVDGGQHGERQAADAARTAWLNSPGHRVLRVWNNEVLSNLDAVKQVIWNAVVSDQGRGPETVAFVIGR